MEDYKLIFEEYQKVTEAGFSYAGNYSDSTLQPKKQLAKFRRAKNDIRNSTAPTTNSLPTSPGAKISMANMGASSGGIAEQEETNARKIPTNEVHNMFRKLMKEVHTLYNKGNYKQMESKLELMAVLTRNM